MRIQYRVTHKIIPIEYDCYAWSEMAAIEKAMKYYGLKCRFLFVCVIIFHKQFPKVKVTKLVDN